MIHAAGTGMSVAVAALFVSENHIDLDPSTYSTPTLEHMQGNPSLTLLQIPVRDRPQRPLES